SEGTLAGIMTAELSLVPLPRHRGLAVICFASVAEAMQAAVELAEFRPAAIEHIDKVLFDQTKGQLAFQSARSLLKLDSDLCESMLLVEFFDDLDDKMTALKSRKFGLRTFTTTDTAEMQAVWGVRRKGLNLLTGCKGPAKPTAGIEDVAVRPEQLPEYVRSLGRILHGVGVQASYYGHAASGTLHVRPVLDLHTAEGVTLYRQIADEVAALTRHFGGSIAGEHGVGIARTEFLPEQLGAELMAAATALKRLFDPKNVFNPGKIVGDGRFRIDTNLRTGADHEILLPFCPVLGFVRRDGSFVGNLEQCNGSGECLKAAPTMCPTYAATRDEIMSTRGRANVIRAVLERRLADPSAVLDAPELDEALSNCLSCKACKAECPSNVDLAALKAELLHARQQRDGVRFVDHLFSAVDLMGRVGSATAPLANAVLRWPALRWLLEKTVGIAAERPLPPYSSQQFDTWFARRETNGAGRRGRVVLWDDTFVRYHEPHIGRAAVAVLEAAGYEVRLPEGRECCGRPAFSRGRLDEAARLGRHNVELLLRMGGDEPVVFLEPSCHSMFVDDYLELDVPGARRIAARCVLFEQFINDLLEREPGALRFRPGARRVAVHGHCHVKALADQGVQARLLNRLPGTSAELMNTGCCGMAGAFGALKSKYELSVRVAQPLVEQIEALPPGTVLVACGTSCRHQITHLTKATPLHVAEVLAKALPASASMPTEVRSGHPIA
ncbi:MAG: 4Fe-4S dicluster domain-containing protein, partial [Phycisphaerales bacterium]